MGSVLTPGRFRRLDGEHRTEEGVRAAFEQQNPGIDVRGWFTEFAIVEDGATWILRRRWDRATEPTLTILRDSFPQAGVTFRKSDGDAGQ